MKHAKVTVVFQPAGGSAVDSVPAANQKVFIDVTAGTMTAAQTNAQGLLVTPAPANKAIELDDTRSYQVVISAAAIVGTPLAPAGAKATVSAGRLILQPHIAIKVSGVTTPLTCSLTIGSTTTSVKPTAGGWITSNNQSSGVVTISAATKNLKLKGTTDPSVTLKYPDTITRGENVKFTINQPTGAVDFKVTGWSYIASHTNPGKPTAVTATILRPAAEASTTFHQFWEGLMCASGGLTARFVCGATLRSMGPTPVSAEVTAGDPIAQAEDITVEAREWETTLVENAEAPLMKAIATAHDTGLHKWAFTNRLVTAKGIAAGPNKGLTFAESATVTFTSSPFINSLLTDAASVFSLAQGKAYLTIPAGVNVSIPKKFYTKDSSGDITLTDKAGFLAHFSITGPFEFTAEAVSQAELLAGTRRHEFNHPSEKSHKGNALKALRALEPKVFIEAQVGFPAAPVNLTALFNTRVDAVSAAGPVHKIVDESATETAGALKFVTGEEIPDINADASGSLTGTVWNPAANRELT